MSKMSEVIALTGSMGSGKSTAGKILAQWIPVNSADEINSRLILPSQAGFEALDRAGFVIRDKNGLLDRKALAALMFENPDIRKEVENILHPLIIREIEDWIKEQDGICAVEVPILFEAGMEKKFGPVWCITCDDETALKRLELGRNISRDEAKARLASQWDKEKKARLSDVVIDNSSDIATLSKQLARALEKEKKQIRKVTDGR